MKFNKKLTILLISTLSVLFISCGTSQTAAEKAEKASNLSEQIENLNFDFTANHAYPQGFQSIHLTSTYEVKVNPDTIKAYLPYFGRAYRAPMGSDEVGIKFKSTDFESTINIGKMKGEWHVTIETKDTPSPIKLYFHLWDNGTARLNVIEQDRQSISFQGVVE